jgi:plastocyanin
MSISRTVLLVTFAVFAAAAQAEDLVLYKLVARDGKFEPAVLEVAAGKRFRLEVTNEGKKPIEFESKDLKQEKVVAAGAKATVYVSPLKPGEYKYVDDFDQSSSGKLVAK